MNSSRIALSKIPNSVSFSGAGFLGCYHLGVASCLVKHKILPGPKELPSGGPSSLSLFTNNSSPTTKTTLLGCSAGSIVAAGISAGVTDEDGMNVILELAQRVKKSGGILDCFRPGFSLIDQLEDLLLNALKKACDDDNEYFLRRIENGKLLRIYIAHPNKLFSSNETQQSDVLYPSRYMDEYRDFEDVVAACMLSSFIPGITGPVRGSLDTFDNKTVQRSSQRIRALCTDIKTSIKDSAGNPVLLTEEEDGISNSRDLYWDGGLCNNWPTIDDSTWIVSPLSGDYSPNLYIAPEYKTDDQDSNSSILPPWLSPPKYVKWHGYRIDINQNNMESMLRMMISSDPDVLQQRFYDGYDDTKKFLEERNII